VAPLVVIGPTTTELVGACTLVSNGGRTVAFSSAELLRSAGEPLMILTQLDGSAAIPVTSWTMGRHSGIGVIELGAEVPVGGDVTPLSIGAVCATIDNRGAPSAIVTIERAAKGYARRAIPVYLDAIDGGGMTDEVLTRLATPIDDGDDDVAIDGAPVFAWFPPDPLLGRPSEIAVVALALPYRIKTFKPRDHVAIAELWGLEDLGRALPFEIDGPEPSNELDQVAGEIRDEGTGPLAGLDLDE